MPIKNPEKLLEWLIGLPRENEWVEFKLSNNNPVSIGKYISALANSAIYNDESHGFLVFGVEDKTHNIVGTSVNIDTQTKGNEALKHWLNKKLDPRINFESCRLEINGHAVEIIRIDPAYKHPVRFDGIAYIRIDESLHPLSQHPQREGAIWQAVNRFSLEDSVASHGLSEEEISDKFAVDDLISGLVNNRSQSGKIDYLQKEKLIKINPEGGYDVTNLFVLTFSKNLKDWSGFTRKGVRLIKFKGQSKLNAEFERQGKLGYFLTFERVLANIMDRTPKREVMQHGLRKEIYDIPAIAVREILANAIIHQDLSSSGFGPTVEIFSDRLVITNPGKPLVDPDRFIDAPSKTRNNNLADLMRRLGMCEERGSGIDRAFTAIENMGLPSPLIQEISGQTVISIFGPRKFAQTSRIERLRACYYHACLCAERNEFMSNASLRERFKLGKNQYPQVSSVISDAIQEGHIKPLSADQANRNARYVPYWF